MNSSTFELKLVILDCPVDLWNEPQQGRFAQEMFQKMIALKLRGYGAEYSDRSLPVDTSDFVGTHLIYCTETEAGLQPVTAYRSISLQRCDRFHLEFPLLEMAKKAKAFGHAEVVEKAIQKCRKEGKSLRYCSSYTTDPLARQNRDLTDVIKSLGCGVHMLYHEAKRTDESLMLGVTKFKVDKMFERQGYKPVILRNEVLPAFNVSYFDNCEVKMVFLERFSAFSEEMAQKAKNLWNSRIELAVSNTDEQSEFGEFKKAA